MFCPFTTPDYPFVIFNLSYVIALEWLSECLLLNANATIVQPYHCENKFIFKIKGILPMLCAKRDKMVLRPMSFDLIDFWCLTPMSFELLILLVLKSNFNERYVQIMH